MDNEDSVQAEMVEIEGGPLGNNPAASTRPEAATFNYVVNVQEKKEKKKKWQILSCLIYWIRKNK